MFKRMFIVLGCVMLIAAPRIGEAGASIIFQEDWESGMDESKWFFNAPEDDPPSQSMTIEDFDGDHAIKLTDVLFTHGFRIYSVRSFPRGGDMTCEFKFWRLAPGGETETNQQFYGVFGPWHFYVPDDGFDVTFDTINNIDIRTTLAGGLGFIRTLIGWRETNALDSTFTYQDGPSLAADFNADVTKFAISKETAVWFRAVLGDQTGATGFYSPDQGQTWIQITDQDGNVIDTRGQPAGAEVMLTGISMGFNPLDDSVIQVNGFTELHLGFGNGVETLFLDDIVVTSTIEPTPTPTPAPTATPGPNAADPLWMLYL